MNAYRFAVLLQKPLPYTQPTNEAGPSLHDAVQSLLFRFLSSLLLGFSISLINIRTEDYEVKKEPTSRMTSSFSEATTMPCNIG